MDFVEICNFCTRKVIIKAAKRIFNSDKICCSYCDFYFASLFYNTVYKALYKFSCYFTFTIVAAVAAELIIYR